MNAHEFFAQAAHRELEAEAFYWKHIGLALAQRDLGASDFFYRMSDFRRLQREAIAKQTGFKDVLQFGWSKEGGRDNSGVTLEAGATTFGLNEAMDIALSTELRDLAFYQKVALTADDAQISRLAEGLATEHRRQVLAVERYMGQKPY